MVTISVDFQDGFAAPSFSYQATVSSLSETDTISKSPSPSISEIEISWAPSAVVAITALVNVGNEYVADVA